MSPLAAGGSTARAGQEACFRGSQREVQQRYAADAGNVQDSDTGQEKTSTRSTHWLMLQGEKMRDGNAAAADCIVCKNNNSGKLVGRFVCRGN